VTRALNWLAVGLLIASLILRSPPLFLATVLLALLAGVTALWDRYALAGVTYMRRLGALRMFVGDETRLEIEVLNAKPLPLAWLRIEDEFPAEMVLLKGRLHFSHKPMRRVLFNLLSLRFYERVRKRYDIKAEQRGRLQFGPAELCSGDMFGFRSQREYVPAVDYITVYPRLVPLTTFGLPSEHPFGDRKGRRKVAEDPLRIMGVRSYVVGDTLRHVHWKASARRGALQTKVFEPSASESAAIFLDVQTVPGHPGLIPHYLEHAICAAASILNYLTDARQAVGLYVNAMLSHRAGLVRLPPSRRPERWTEMMDVLAQLNGLHSAIMSRYLRAEMGSLPFGATIIVISAVVSDDLAASLLDLKRAGHPVVLLAVGDEPPALAPEGITCYWIGGKEAYQQLEHFDLVELISSPAAGPAWERRNAV